MLRLHPAAAGAALALAFLWPAALPATEPPVDLDDPEVIESGRAIYNDTCAGYCHGIDGTAGGQADTFQDQGLSVDHIRETILNGVPDTAMPPWEGTLPDADIWAVTAFLASLQGEAEVIEREVAEELPEGPLTVCVPPDRPPYAMQDGNRPGFEVEIAEAVLGTAGIESRIAYTTASDDPASYRCDLYMGRARPAEARRLGDRFYTQPYYGSAFILAMPAGEPGSGVAVEAASFAERLLEDRNLDAVLLASQDAVLDAIAAGEVEGGLVRLPELAWRLEQASDPGVLAELAREPERDSRWNAAIEVHAPGGALEEALNAAIAELVADGTVAAVFEGYGLPYHEPFARTRQD